MTRRPVIRYGAAAAILAAAVSVTAHLPVVSVTAAQTPRNTPADPSVALLAEVRALRAEIAEVSRASLRAQMLLARVQLQEQRIIYLDRRRADVTTRIADAAEKTREARSRHQSLDAQLRGLNASSPSTTVPAEELATVRGMVEQQLNEARAGWQAASDLEQRLRAEEADVQAGLATEQGAWRDFNQRLDDLERTLPR